MDKVEREFYRGRREINVTSLNDVVHYLILIRGWLALGDNNTTPFFNSDHAFPITRSVF